MELEPNAPRNPLKEYFRIDREEGMVHMLDPLSNEKIVADKIPSCIQKNSFASAGIAYLKDSAVELHVILGLHGGQKDFDSLRHVATSVIQRSDVVAVENEVDLTDREVLLRAPKFPMRLSPDDSGHGIYQKAQLKWLESLGKIILPCDHLLDPKDENTLTATLSKIHLQREEIGGQDKAMDFMTYGFYQNLQEWDMIGRIGCQMESLGREQPQKLTIILGSLHMPIIEKLEKLGLTPSYDLIKRSSFPSPIQEAHMKYIASGSISLWEIEEVTKAYVQ